MASFDAHVAIVQQNSDLLSNVLIPVIAQHPDWVVTVAFYTALHMVEAMFHEDLAAQHTHDHKQRERILLGHRYNHIWHDYRVLYSKSRLARYLQQDTATRPHYVASFTAHCPPRIIVPSFISGSLAEVRTRTESIIAHTRTGFTFPTVTLPPTPSSPPASPPSAAAGS